MQREVAVAQLAAIVETSYDAIISKDLNSVVTSWNPAAERLFGYSAAEMIGQPITRIIPSELQDEEGRIVAQIHADGTIDRYETKIRDKYGRPIMVELTVSPIKDANGKVIGAAKIVRDIAERKAAEHQTAELAAIVQSTYDAIISRDLNSIVTSWNPGAERLFGFSAAEMIGQSIFRNHSRRPP